MRVTWDVGEEGRGVGSQLAGRQDRALAPVTAALFPPPSIGVGPAHPVPVDGFFDYLDDVSESTFVSPTKRQPEKVGRQKSKEKKDGCKQQ